MDRQEAKINDLQSQWELLLKDEQRAFDVCVSMDNEGATQKEKSEYVRKWWSIANAVLRMHKQTRLDLDHELIPYPLEFFVRLANISEEISNGIIPSFVTDAKNGGRNLRRAERHDMAFGVFYVEAANQGSIDDGGSTRTVAEAYNVTMRTVRNWVRDRERICLGVPHTHLSPEQITDKMKECGARYTRIGRGAPSEY